jgi:hypothetical protein
MITKTAADPASLYGNPARQYPTKVLLDVDAAFAGVEPPKPPSLPHGGAGPQDPAMHNAAYQEWADWTGVLNQIIIIQDAGGGPDDTQLKRIAFNSGVSFTYRGVSYFNKADGGVYIPG